MLTDHSTFGINKLPYILQFLYLCGLLGVGFLVLFVLMLGICTVSGVGVGFVENLDPKNLSAKEINVLKLLQVAQVLIFVIPALLFSWLKKGAWTTYWGNEGKLNFQAFMMVVGVVVFCFPLIMLIGLWNQGITFPNIEFLKEIEAWMRESEDQALELTTAFLKMDGLLDLMIAIFIVAVLAAVGEELFFRGTLQQLLQEWTQSGHVAIFITAFAFSFFHFQFYGFFPRLLLGVFLGYLLLWSKNIWYPIVAHFLFNGIQVVATYANYMETEPTIPDDMMTKLLPTAGFSTLMLAASGYLFYRVFHPKMEQVS